MLEQNTQDKRNKNNIQRILINRYIVDVNISAINSDRRYFSNYYNNENTNKRWSAFTMGVALFVFVGKVVIGLRNDMMLVAPFYMSIIRMSLRHEPYK